ncbi:MAG: carbamoyl-phosphate synthase large subunit [Gammaproteobacteria bacterium]|nr:MAG: carbamoyl-phosphate synthase large subunit [Gammaproteobacteria bacterium]
MPKRTDLESILIIGAGPIVIGQACEFDYSGAQACKALREEGYRVVLVNSNPATIMTDPDSADATYIEPIHWRNVARIIEKERPNAILPTMGGQTALNCTLDLEREGILKKFTVQMIGATKEAIDKAEDREQFRVAMDAIGLETARGAIAHSLEEAHQVQAAIGFPVIIRPSFTMGGSGGGVAYNREEFIDICERGLDASPTRELLIEESILGWKEYEMEVVRDRADNCIIICSIENLDPMGVHTGDSITVAPAQTLTDKEYQIMRNASLAVLREIGVDTGGSNVQFAINPEDGRMIIIEMNPRVSRSSALASKATGFPIAKVAAKLAVGYTLDELQNDITGGVTPASFEPSIDYVVTKVPRFTFEKFPNADATLTTQMKSVGEAMAIGRTFQESLQKALRSLEIGVYGLEPKLGDDLGKAEAREKLKNKLITPTADRLWYVGDAFRYGMKVDEVFALTAIDPWFLDQIQELIKMEKSIARYHGKKPGEKKVWQWKRAGFSDRRIADLMGLKEDRFRKLRHQLNVRPVYKRVDSCAAEFASSTAYMYSTYEEECEAQPEARDKIMVLGGGPNRIGQGIEFDYCCVHAAFALREDGYQTIMVNCNPETVSTDYDTSDRLYFEPLTLEDVLEIVHVEQPKGVIVQYGGQTPLKLSRGLEAAGAPIIGTSPDSIDLAEDRERFQRLLKRLKLRQPPNATAKDQKSAIRKAKKIGYPLVVRPSYVLGGRAMEIVHSVDDLDTYMRIAVQVSEDSPVLLDKFLNDAIEVDVDAISDGKDVVIGGIMQHIEEAGVHSGDSACSLPPFSLTQKIQNNLREQTRQLAKGLKVVGLMNIQFAIKGNDIYVLEVNPRASRTVPFVSKATGRALAKVAARCMAGQTLADQGITKEVIPGYYSVKEAVFPFIKFPGVDTMLGPEMKSTGEVMGIGKTFGEAFFKSQLAAGASIPRKGKLFITLRDADQSAAVEVARDFSDHGYELLATRGTAAILEAAGLEVRAVNKVSQGRPHVVDMVMNNEIDIILNTVSDKQSLEDASMIRRVGLLHKVTYYTTLAAARAASEALLQQQEQVSSVSCLQTLHEEIS